MIVLTCLFWSGDAEREETLRNNLFKINQEVAAIVASFS